MNQTPNGMPRASGLRTSRKNATRWVGSSSMSVTSSFWQHPFQHHSVVRPARSLHPNIDGTGFITDLVLLQCRSHDSFDERSLHLARWRGACRVEEGERLHNA